MIRAAVETSPFDMPRTLRDKARWTHLGDGVPALLAHPDWSSSRPVPAVIWMHGRTAHKELDPGRYLRWLRGGMGVCAVDLPGHGERRHPAGQDPEGSVSIVLQMVAEIDDVVAALAKAGGFDGDRLGIGGMSAGGMAALARLCRPHPFRCVSVEAATGAWGHQRRRRMFQGMSDEQIAAIDPLHHLDGWRPIPFQAFHSEADEMVDFEGQREFVEALRRRYDDPELVELVHFERTGAPAEHGGFGRLASEVKNRQAEFFSRWLLGPAG